MARMSSEEFTDAWKTQATKRRLEGLDWAQLSLRTVLVDPPRAGLDPGVRAVCVCVFVCVVNERPCCM